MTQLTSSANLFHASFTMRTHWEPSTSSASSCQICCKSSPSFRPIKSGDFGGTWHFKLVVAWISELQVSRKTFCPHRPGLSRASLPACRRETIRPRTKMIIQKKDGWTLTIMLYQCCFVGSFMFVSNTCWTQKTPTKTPMFCWTTNKYRPMKKQRWNRRCQRSSSCCCITSFTTWTNTRNWQVVRSKFAPRLQDILQL